MRTTTRNRNLAMLSALALLLLATVVFAGEEIVEFASGAESEEALARQASLPRERAEALALAAVPGSIKGTELEREDGRIVYEIGIRPQAGGKDMEVLVDATTGEVLKTQED